MKRFLFLMVALAAMSWPAGAQFIGYVSPQGVVATPFNAVFAPAISGCILNEGQTVHFLSYTQPPGGNGVQIQLEASYNSDSATCTTGTWQIISDQGSNLTGGAVLAVGYYPFIRAHLVVCGICQGLTANYSGISSAPSNLFGLYDPSQQSRKVIATQASMGSGLNQTITSTPYGSPAGFLVYVPQGATPAGSTISLSVSYNSGSTTFASFALSALNQIQIFPTPSSPNALFSLTVAYTSGGASASVFSLYYVFLSPAGSLPPSAQPMTLANSESTSAPNTAVSVTLSHLTLARGHLFSVGARCSAGTAQLTVTDGGTAIWSTGATEVGTTTFTKSWNPGLAAGANNNLVITLGTCGVGNTGTLDVQASQI